MKIIASCLLALGAVSSTSAFVSPLAGRAAVQLRSEAETNGEANGVETNGVLTTAADPASYELLGLPARPGRPLKVAIAGGGVGGLTAAYYMLKKVRRKKIGTRLFTPPLSRMSNEIILFEKYNPLSSFFVVSKFCRALM